MARKRRKLTPFGLAFLDIMSSGFGAVVLLFLIIKHNIDAAVSAAAATPDLGGEIRLLEKEIGESEEELAKLRDAAAKIDQETAGAEGSARRIRKKIEGTKQETELPKAESVSNEIARLQAEIGKLEKQKQQRAEESQEGGKHLRAFTGEGERQYLTGMRLGGERVLILLDASASMLDETLVNIIRRRNMPDRRKLAGSKKWRQATTIVDWLSAHFPGASQYQIYLFNTEVKSAVGGSEGTWLKAGDLAQLNRAVTSVKAAVPEGGTSLEKAFLAIKKLQPLPDNLYLITDGLPTQGVKPPLFGSKVSGKERLKLFEEALRQLPGNIPVNIFLLPMEGDLLATHSFWRLAILSRGSLISPAAEWP